MLRFKRWLNIAPDLLIWISLCGPSAAFGQVRFIEESAPRSKFVGFKAPNSIASNLLWTLPAADGSANQCLATDGSGNLLWRNSATTTAHTLEASDGNPQAAVFVDADGKVGIGTTSPASRLEINGGIKLSDDTSPCGAPSAGTFKWTGTILMFCDGASWKIVKLEVPVPDIVLVSGSGVNMDVTGPGSPFNYGSPAVFTYQNTGGATASTLSATLSNDANFEITADTCSGSPLAISAMCTVTVRPKALANGSYSASLIMNW